MRIAIAIFLSALGGLPAGCAASRRSSPEPDAPFLQEVSEQWSGTDAPAGAPQDFLLPPRQVEDAPGARVPVLPVRGAVESGGDLWCATARGLLRRQGSGEAARWRYYAGRRWLPDDDVTGLAPDGAGGVWARTASGFARIRRVSMTLEEKARTFHERVRARHLRHGLVATSRLRRPGDLSSSMTLTNDNDGLWTAMYVAAESFRWAVTGEEEARRNARESYRAIERLQTVTGIPGLPARSVVRKDEPTGGDGEWHPTQDGEWLWKGDTSSDEIDGHFFVAGIFHDLVAEGAERESIRRNVRALMDHIIDHGWHLVDVDGKPTTWGVWTPGKLNADSAWWREKGLNSLEILSYLSVAARITGEARYRAAAGELIEKHGYAENTVMQKVIEPPEEVNHSDDELAFLAYHNLLRYEEDPALLAVYRRSLARSIVIEEPEANPLWNAIALAGGVSDVEASGTVRLGPPAPSGRLLQAAVRTLRDTPLDMVEWTMANSHRRDLERAAHSSRFGRPIAARPLHPAERGGIKYNSDPYVLDAGHGGSTEDDGSFFLLAYWMARHHGLIAAPAR